MFFNPLQISLLGKASLALSLKKGVFKNEIRVCLIRIEGRGREHADKVLRLVGIWNPYPAIDGQDPRPVQDIITLALTQLDFHLVNNRLVVVFFPLWLTC